MMARYALLTLLLGWPVTLVPAEPSLSFTKVWTYGHTTPGQVSEIPAFDKRTNAPNSNPLYCLPRSVTPGSSTWPCRRHPVDLASRQGAPSGSRATRNLT